MRVFLKARLASKYAGIVGGGDGERYKEKLWAQAVHKTRLWCCRCRHGTRISENVGEVGKATA